jgi:ABC-2 type transport system permease protein
MQVYLTLTRRELGSMFSSMAGFIIIAGAVFLMGMSLMDMLMLLQGQAMPVPITQMFYNTGFFWQILLLATPLITMRLFAHEKFSGTFETLMTAPVSDLEVVLAKYTAAMIFFNLLWLPSIGSMLVLRQYMSRVDVFDPGLLCSMYLGVFLLGALFVSLGCFASAMTRSQIVAAMISFTMGYTLYLMSFLPGHLPVTQGWRGTLASYVSLFDHMTEFSRGTVDSRYVVFYITATLFFLYLTLRTVQSRRWK